ncbi:hypothetical protein MBT42_00430 [Streptomyces sp. MBT42]|uniref:hypothetical protein n=1 Tax=Streptomyces sp. MBT42 TaxID=1488373 RepID=UPI001E2CE1FE|nr:hypothetical protein [Streptomyces sp. MBT42]MCD2462023.1 hypothetical protein [Streptomyces sp. MBT42]
MQYRTNRRVVAAALISTAVTTLAACGPADTGADSKSSAGADSAGSSTLNPEDSFSGLTGAQISDKSLDAFRSATSVRLTGDAPNPRGSGTFTLDIALDIAGSCRGTITMPGAGTLNVIKGRGAYFVQGDETFWRTSMAAAVKNKPNAQKADAFLKKVKGRWIKMNKKTAKAFASSPMCDLAAMTKQFKSHSPESTERGADVTRDGRKLAVIYERDGYQVTTSYISQGDQPYPVEITATGGSAPMDVKLTDYGKPVDTTPPPADQIISPEELGLTPSRRA